MPTLMIAGATDGLVRAVAAGTVGVTGWIVATGGDGQVLVQSRPRGGTNPQESRTLAIFFWQHRESEGRFCFVLFSLWLSVCLQVHGGMTTAENAALPSDLWW